MSHSNPETELDYGITREEAVSRVVNVLDAVYNCWQSPRCDPDEFQILLGTAQAYLQLIKYL